MGKDLEVAKAQYDALYRERGKLFDLASDSKEKLEAAEQKLNRLTSRGFEDLHDENEQLKQKLKKVSELSEKWRRGVLIGVFPPNTARDCADELQQIIGEGDD